MDILAQVVTVREAALMYYRSTRNILYHCYEGHLAYRKTFGAKSSAILIDGSSLVTLWGSPPNQIVASGNKFLGKV